MRITIIKSCRIYNFPQLFILIDFLWNASFISAFDENFPFDTRNMLYAFDADQRGDGGLTPGYFGYRFMESPGIDNDGFDNDNDGLVDESPFNDAGSEIVGPWSGIRRRFDVGST